MLEGDAPGERGAVGEADTVELPLAVLLGVPDAVPVLEAVGVPVETLEGV